MIKIKMNILPKKEKELIVSGFKKRFVIVASILISFVFIIGSVGLIPTLIMLSSDFIRGGGTVQNVGEENIDKEILKLPAEIETRMKILEQHLQNKSFISYTRDALLLLPQNVQINGISFDRSKIYNYNEGVWMMLTGFSKDRSSLIEYINRLRATQKFLLVEVPVTDLTRETNFRFSINLVFKK